MSENFIRQIPSEDSTDDIGAQLADDTVFEAVFKDSALVAAGLIDLAKVRAAQDHLRAHPNSQRALFPLRSAFILELCLKSLGK